VQVDPEIAAEPVPGPSDGQAEYVDLVYGLRDRREDPVGEVMGCFRRAPLDGHSRAGHSYVNRRIL
jgi:hypothetical protein